MNIIDIEDNNVTLKLKEKEVKCNYSISENIFEITKINIEIVKDTDLKIIIDDNNFKADFNIIINNGIKCYINISSNISTGKIRFNYQLNDNSNLTVDKINDSDNIKELVIADLNGCDSLFNYNLNSFIKTNDNYNIIVSHNNKNTTSNLNCNIINISGTASLQTSTYINESALKSLINNNFNIINKTNKKIDVKPNIYDDTKTAKVNSKTNMFGQIKMNDILKIISKKLLNQEYKNDLQNLLNKHWR